MDARNKRASALGFALASLMVLPAPDTSLSSSDRAHLAYSYAAEAAAPIEESGALVLVGDQVVTTIAHGTEAIGATTITVGDEAVTTITVGDALVTS